LGSPRLTEPWCPVNYLTGDGYLWYYFQIKNGGGCKGQRERSELLFVLATAPIA